MLCALPSYPSLADQSKLLLFVPDIRCRYMLITLAPSRARREATARPYMITKDPVIAVCPSRDAQRKWERILEAAKAAFTRSGTNTSLDDIAKEAGRLSGTLYRHFPTREALLEAVTRIRPRTKRGKRP